MAFSLIDLIRADFRTTKAADNLNERFQGLLGLPHRYGPARLAIGRSLGVPGQPVDMDLTTGQGKPIKGENLLGTGIDLATWVALVVEHAGEPELDRRSLQALVGAHWHRGIYLLWEDWKRCGTNFDAFMDLLVRRASEQKGKA